MKYDKNTWLLYAITDRAWVGTQTLNQQAEAALKGGITCLQLREKHLDEKSLLAEALEIQQLCRRYQVPFLINDHVDLAKKIGADGVHVGQSDRNAKEARAILGEQKLLGVSVQTVEQALLAEQNGADYLGVGAVFPTASKADAAEVPLNTLKNICSSVHIPVVAIGGIHAQNLCRLKGSGICGIATISAVFAAKNIEEETRKLKKLTEKVVRL